MCYNIYGDSNITITSISMGRARGSGCGDGRRDLRYGSAKQTKQTKTSPHPALSRYNI